MKHFIYNFTNWNLLLDENCSIDVTLLSISEIVFSLFLRSSLSEFSFEKYSGCLSFMSQYVKSVFQHARFRRLVSVSSMMAVSRHILSTSYRCLLLNIHIHRLYIKIYLLELLFFFLNLFPKSHFIL